jgi:choline dehydrogenase-like flavoprotein
LSAGAVGTPQILLLSGIGDAHALGALGINVIVDNANVGQNLQDHVFLTNNWYIKGNPFTYDVVYQDASAKQQLINQWQQGKGPLVNNAANFIAWLRNPTNVAPFNTLPDPR